MPREFVLPELAESVVEGEIVKWLVNEGDVVSEDQPIVEVMTDKVTVELPSPFAGVLEKQLVAEGDVIPVHQAIALFSDDATKPAAAQANVQAQEERSIVESGAAPAEDDGDSLSLFTPSADDSNEPVFEVKRASQTSTPAPKVTGPYGRVLAVPAARKLARDLNIDINAVKGSGPNGRIRVDDVKAHQQQTRNSSASATPASSGAAMPAFKRIQPASSEAYAALEERIPVRGLRRAIANQMVASHLQSVRTLHVDEADVSALVTLRERLKPKAQARGVKLSYLPFIMKAVVAALKAFPMINASLDEATNEIIRKHYYNLGMAVATDVGLVVPVVQQVDQKSILEIASDIHTLAAKAREGKLGPDDVKHGTFSITNIGTLGGLFSFPIINVPEAAILGVHSIKKRPVVLEDDSIVARPMLYLSMSFDHRVIDGAEAAMFTSYLIEILETPEMLLLEG